MRTWSVVSLAAALSFALLFLIGEARSQGSGSTRIPSTGTQPYPGTQPYQRPRQQTPEEFYRSFWTYISDPKLPYTKWTRFPAGDKDFREGKPPHGVKVRIYANKIAAADPKLPYDSVLVAENLADDGKTLQSVMALYRVRGSAPKGGDWYWLQYDPNGAIDRDATKRPIAGAVQSCTACHQKAQGRDLVYSNDPVKEPPSESNPKSEDAPKDKDASK